MSDAKREAITAPAGGPPTGEAATHPIEAESYRRLRAAVDTTHLPPLTRAVTERIVHATADVDFVVDVAAVEDDLAAGVAALARGAPVVTDVGMVAAGLAAGLGRRAVCRVGDPRAARQAEHAGATRSACGLRLALAEAGGDAVVVIGCAPTAAAALAADWAAMDPAPALVIALPVGFVDAVEAKAAVRDAGVPAVTNHGPKGGSPAAVAAVNALAACGHRGRP